MFERRRRRRRREGTVHGWKKRIPHQLTRTLRQQGERSKGAQKIKPEQREKQRHQQSERAEETSESEEKERGDKVTGRKCIRKSRSRGRITRIAIFLFLSACLLAYLLVLNAIASVEEGEKGKERRKRGKRRRCLHPLGLVWAEREIK